MRKAIRLGMCLAIIMAMTGTVYADNGVMPCYTYVNIIRATLNGVYIAYSNSQGTDRVFTTSDRWTP